MISLSCVPCVPMGSSRLDNAIKYITIDINNMTILKSLFSSNLRIGILAHFFSRPDEAFHVRGLGNILQEPASNISLELINLEKAGILKSRKVGNQRHYSLCPANPIYHELRMIFLKTTGVGEEIRKALGEIPGVELAFIFGSFAKGDAGATSDVDMAMIGNASARVLAPAIAKIEKKINREISYHAWSRMEAEKQRGNEGDFLYEVFTGPRILLIGQPDDGLFQTDQPAQD